MDIRLNTAPQPAPDPTTTRAASLQGVDRPRATAARQRPAPATPAPAPAPTNSAAVEQVARQINEFLASSSVSLRFVVDRDSSKVVVRIVDPGTDEVIRQIPYEEMLAISRALKQISGLLIKQKS